METDNNVSNNAKLRLSKSFIKYPFKVKQSVLYLTVSPVYIISLLRKI